LVVGGIEGAQAEALDRGEDVVSGLCPSEGFGVCIGDGDIAFDCRLEICGRTMDATADLSAGEMGEEAFNLIDPGGSGGCEVNLPMRSSGNQARIVAVLCVA
jgi:hypothetical protein